MVGPQPSPLLCCGPVSELRWTIEVTANLINTALAIAGWLAFCGIITLAFRFITNVLNYAGDTHSDFADQFAHGGHPHLPLELRTSQRIGSHRASAGPSGTNPTQVLLPSTRLLVGGERIFNA